MPKMTITDEDGKSLQTINVASGGSLMEALRDQDIDGIIAVCGGSCACATCQVYIDPDFFELVGKPGADELDMIESSGIEKPNSRLSCQIQVTDALEGLRFAIAPNG